jgi:hypothetical protein
MRLVACTVLAFWTIVAAVPARAQAYDPNYPVCLETYGIDGFVDCSFTSMAQCAASASGRAAQCLINPYFAARGRPPGRIYRR